MLFSSPDYPIFLIAVFFLYALARWSGLGLSNRWPWLAVASRCARFAIMLLLGDLVFLLVSKDPNTLWDPLGGTLYRLVAQTPWDWDLAWRWTLGAGVVIGAGFLGRAKAAWIVSPRGQSAIGRAIVVVLVVVGGAVGYAMYADHDDQVREFKNLLWAILGQPEQPPVLEVLTQAIVAHGHLLVLAVLGVGLGASRTQDHRPLGRVIILFVASSLFYHAWAAAMPGPYRYLLGLLLGTITLDYYLGIWIEGTEDPTARKLLLGLSLVSNLGILFFFKYFDFFTQDVAHLPIKPLNLILPAGISFHTFQSLSYTIDVYRKQLPATRSVIQFATFVLFFPQLVAGPIVRAQDLLPQLAELPRLELEAATRGLFRIVVGLFKKIALADTLALSIVERVFADPTHFSSVEVIAGVYAYALQIYLDFSAYSDIAIGSAEVLGFTLPKNFETPYRSASLQEFWRRWHISLSTWLRDYLYITLGGSRGRPWQTYLNLSLTMLLGGLWHGASWAFIVWGGLHGFGLAVTRFFQRSDHDRRQLFAVTGAIAAIGIGSEWLLLDGQGAWVRLVVGWLTVTPLWAMCTAWLAGDGDAKPWYTAPTDGGTTVAADALRWAMCATAIGFLAALAYGPTWTWIPLIALAWALGLAADLAESTAADVLVLLRRAGAIALTFQYVCLAWIFFRAPTFADALAVLEQIGKGELDHANLVPIVTTALATGFLCHFWADGSFAWLGRQFARLREVGVRYRGMTFGGWLVQGLVLALAAMVLRELSHQKIVPFIYFQF